MKRVINFVKGKRDERRENKFSITPICVEITNPAGQKIQSEDEHILGLQSGYGYQIDVNGKDKNMSKFHKTAWQGNLEKLKVHLKKTDVNLVDHLNRTALHFAVAQGHSNVAWFLLSSKASMDIRDSDGMTPFLKAVECGNKECVNMLLEQGADVNAVDRSGNTGLHLASKLGFLNISSLLLKRGANFSTSNNVGEFPLHLAAEGEHRELAALLLCAGAHANVIDRDNRTPLMLAARYGISTLVSLFLEHGASLEACDSNGWTAEDYALIGGHQQLAVELKAPNREQVCKELEEAVVNGNCSDENGNNQSTNNLVLEEDEELAESNEREERGREEGGETVESPRSCVTPPPLQPPRSWDLIQAGMIDENQVQRRSLTALGTLRSRRESFNENSNNNNNGGTSPNQGQGDCADLEKINDIVKKVQTDGGGDIASSGSEESLPLDKVEPSVGVGELCRKVVAPLERTPSLDLTEEDPSRSKDSCGVPSSDGGTLGREDTLQGYEEIWEKNVNINDTVVDNVLSENNNKLMVLDLAGTAGVNGPSNDFYDTGQLSTEISDQFAKRNREINSAVGYVTNEIYRTMVEKTNPVNDGTDTVHVLDTNINQTVHVSSSLDNLDDYKQTFIEIESSRSCDNLDNKYMTLEEKLCSGIYSADTLNDTEASVNETEGAQSLDNLDESPIGTVVKRNVYREVQSLDTLDDYVPCCSRGCMEARPNKKHARNKSVSVSSHGWSKSVDVLSKPSNIEKIQVDTKKIDAQLECYDEALRELAQDEMLKRNSLNRSTPRDSSSSFSFDKRTDSTKSENFNNEGLPPPPPPLNRGPIPYFSEVVGSSTQKSRDYFLKPKDDTDFTVNQDSSPIPKVHDKSRSVDGLLDSDKVCSFVENYNLQMYDPRCNQPVTTDYDSDPIFNQELPPPPPDLATINDFQNENYETEPLACNVEKPPPITLAHEKPLNGTLCKKKEEDDDEDSEAKRRREFENNLYKLEKDLFNINMSAVLKPLPQVLKNGIQDGRVNSELLSFATTKTYRFNVGRTDGKQSNLHFIDGSLNVRKQEEDSLSPVERSAGEESPKAPPRYKKSLRKGKSESEMRTVVKSYKVRSKSASMYAEVESLFDKPFKMRKKSETGGPVLHEKSESDSELCERPLRRKRKMLLAMRGVVAGSKDSEDDDDTSTGDPPFWLSTDKGGHFARQDTVLAAQPPRPSAKPKEMVGTIKENQGGGNDKVEDKEWTSSDPDTASGSGDITPGHTYTLGSHHKLLKEHLRNATNEKAILEETVAELREREERLQYELADAQQALAAREDTIAILQEQVARMEAKYSTSLDEAQTLRHQVTSSEVELKHLREHVEKLGQEKADLREQLSREQARTPLERSLLELEEKKKFQDAMLQFEIHKQENLVQLQKQKQDAEKRNEMLVNHLEEVMRQYESTRDEKDALAAQNIADIKKLQKDTLLWKERYEECLSRLERVESENQPRLLDAQRTIEVMRTSIKELEANKDQEQELWKIKVMNLSTNTLKAESSKDLLRDVEKLTVARPAVDYTQQAATSASSMIGQGDNAIDVDFQQVENQERLDDNFVKRQPAVDHNGDKIVNDVQDSGANSKKNLLSRERQEMAVGRIRQQALLESENNLSTRIAEINAVLHQQLEEQDRRREHNEMQMKKEFELTRQKLLMELSRVQSALKAKEAEERALREKCEKLTRDVEKTAELKRKQLIEKSYSLNLAQPSNMWEKELSIKQSVVQPPPPPPPPLPDIPAALPVDNPFSHESLRAQLHQSITKHRNSSRSSSDQASISTNATNSKFEEMANNSGSSGAKR